MQRTVEPSSGVEMLSSIIYPQNRLHRRTRDPSAIADVLVIKVIIYLLKFLIYVSLKICCYYQPALYIQSQKMYTSFT